MSTIGGANIVSDGLVLCLDAANRKSYVNGSTVWRDLSGNNNTGSLVNGPTFSSANGGSIVFDGVNDYSENILPVYSSFTIFIWIYLISGVAILSYGNSSSKPILLLDISDINNLRVYVNDYYQTYSGVLAINKWNCITIRTYITPTATREVYINGGFVGSNTYNIDTNQIGVLRFPVFGQLSSFGNHRVSNCIVYNRALSVQEIEQNYEALKSRYI